MNANKKKHINAIQSTRKMKKKYGSENEILESNDNNKRYNKSTSNHDKRIINSNVSTIRKNNLVGGYMKDVVLLGTGTCCCC